MDLRHFRYFQAVAEELSFSKAARRLRIAQPALSRSVKDLEQELGVLLFDRTRRSVALTPAGTVLLRETSVLLQLFEESIRRVRRVAAGEEGELRLGYIGPPTQPFLGRILREYRRRYPRVSLVLEERTPERVWEMVGRGSLAVGLTRPVLHKEALRLASLLLRREELWGVFPRGHPLAARAQIGWRDLAEEPLVILARREGVGLHDTILSACRAARFTPKLAHTPSLINAVRCYVEAGAGVGVVPESVAQPDEAGPLIFRPLVPVRTVDLVMVWSRENESPPAVSFRKLLSEWLRSDQLWSG